MTLYLDANATTPLDPRVAEAMHRVEQVAFGNPSSLHRQGRLAREELDRARSRIAQCFAVSPRAVTFVSGATEANNLALSSLHGHLPASSRILVADIEHPSILEPVAHLASLGRAISLLPATREGFVDLDKLQQGLSDEPVGAVVIQAVNNETGAIQPLDQVSKLLAGSNICLFSDITQAVGRISISLSDLNIEMASVSGHKICGPKGIGCLISSTSLPIHPLFRGGHQERDHRAGTENTPAAVGLSIAIELAFAEREERVLRWTRQKQEIEQSILRAHPRSRPNVDTLRSVSNTLNMHLPGIPSAALLVRLDLDGLAISTGSACASGSTEPSHVLRAMGRSNQELREILRISMTPTTTDEEIRRAGEILENAIPQVGDLAHRRTIRAGTRPLRPPKMKGQREDEPGGGTP